MNKSPKFTFRKEYLDIIDTLSDEEALKFYKAIINYGFYKEDYKFDNDLENSIFSLIKITIDKDRDIVLSDNDFPSERESSAKEKEFPSFDEMKTVQPEMITLSEQLIRDGMTGGIGINKYQQKILGVTSLKKGWLQDLIGIQISKDDYNKFLSFKGITSK